MIIRRAELRDLRELVAIYAQDPLRGARERPDEPLVPEYEAAFREIDADPQQRLLVAESDGRVVGTLQMTLIRHVLGRGLRRALLAAVFVAPSARGRGIGSTLVSHAAAEAAVEGCVSLELASNASRTRAHRFYERLGFAATQVGFKRALP